jgi:PncC family amidohydrolase
LVGTAISPGSDLFNAERDRPMAPHTGKTERFHHDHHTNRPGSAVNVLLPAAETIAKRLIARHETIATAESSTGGLIAAALLAVPGASAYFLGGAVVYTELARAALLGIGDAEMQGLRSATETYALLLARRVRARHAAVWGVGETGATGPTGNRHGIRRDTHVLRSPVRPSGQSRCAPETQAGVRIWRPSPRARSNCLERSFLPCRANSTGVESSDSADRYSIPPSATSAFL